MKRCSTSLIIREMKMKIKMRFDLTLVRMVIIKKSVLCCAVLCLATQLCLSLCDPKDCNPPGSSVHGDSPGKNTGVGCHALLQGIFPTQNQSQVSRIAGRFFISWATLETPSSKSLQIINAGEGVEKVEPCYTVGGNVNWHSHYGKQYRDFLN